MNLPYQLDRSVIIQAPPETVFRFFTDTARWAAWWGTGSTIDPKPGGAVYIRYPNAIEASGEVIEIEAPRRLVFTFGFNSGKPIAVGGSRVSILLKPDSHGTLVTLIHDLAEESLRAELVQGWRYQMSVFSNAVSDEVNAGASAAVDEWFSAWAITDASGRLETLRRIAEPDVQFRDRFSLLAGFEDLVVHLGASQRFMPGIRLERRGEIRHCQGTVLADWAAVTADGTERMAGTNVFLFGPNGKLITVTGVMNPPPSK
ncbi:MAG: SRPBCC domain-containing protein [Acidobacteriota bacterium]